MYWIHFPWLCWALTRPMLSNQGLSVWPRSTMWNVNDVLSQLDEKIWVILPACTTSEGVYYSSQRCYSVLFTLILHIWDSLVIRGRKSLRCYHNCSRAGRSLTQDVNPPVMERPSLAQRLGPHGPPPRRNIHQRARTPSWPAPNMRPANGRGVESAAAGGPKGGKRGSEPGWPLRTEPWKSKGEWAMGFGLRPAAPPPLPPPPRSNHLFKTTCVNEICSGIFRAADFNPKWKEGRSALFVFPRCILSLLPPPF